MGNKTFTVKYIIRAVDEFSKTAQNIRNSLAGQVSAAQKAAEKTQQAAASAARKQNAASSTAAAAGAVLAAQTLKQTQAAAKKTTETARKRTKTTEKGTAEVKKAAAEQTKAVNEAVKKREPTEKQLAYRQRQRAQKEINDRYRAHKKHFHDISKQNAKEVNAYLRNKRKAEKATEKGTTEVKKAAAEQTKAVNEAVKKREPTEKQLAYRQRQRAQKEINDRYRAHKKHFRDIAKQNAKEVNEYLRNKRKVEKGVQKGTTTKGKPLADAGSHEEIRKRVLARRKVAKKAQEAQPARPPTPKEAYEIRRAATLEARKKAREARAAARAQREAYEKRRETILEARKHAKAERAMLRAQQDPARKKQEAIAKQELKARLDRHTRAMAVQKKEQERLAQIARAATPVTPTQTATKTARVVRTHAEEAARRAALGDIAGAAPISQSKAERQRAAAAEKTRQAKLEAEKQAKEQARVREAAKRQRIEQQEAAAALEKQRQRALQDQRIQEARKAAERVQREKAAASTETKRSADRIAQQRAQAIAERNRLTQVGQARREHVLNHNRQQRKQWIEDIRRHQAASAREKLTRRLQRHHDEISGRATYRDRLALHDRLNLQRRLTNHLHAQQRAERTQQAFLQNRLQLHDRLRLHQRLTHHQTQQQRRQELHQRLGLHNRLQLQQRLAHHQIQTQTRQQRQERARLRSEALQAGGGGGGGRGGGGRGGGGRGGGGRGGGGGGRGGPPRDPEIALAQRAAAASRSSRNREMRQRMDTLGRAGGFGAIYAHQVGRLLSKFKNAERDYAETQSKFSFVFDKQLTEAKRLATVTGKQFGLGDSTIKRYMATAGDTLQNFGFSQDKAIKLSAELAGLAVDTVSFKNIAGGTDQVMQAFINALLGENERLKTIGIAILKKDVIAEAVRLIKEEGVRFTSEREAMAMATLGLIKKQSTRAIGDFQRTITSFANLERSVQEESKHFFETMGRALIPAFTLWNKFLLLLMRTFDTFSPLTQKIVALSLVVSAVAFGFLALVGVMRLFAWPAITAGWAMLTGALQATSVSAALTALNLRSATRAAIASSAAATAAAGANIGPMLPGVFSSWRGFWINMRRWALLAGATLTGVFARIGGALTLGLLVAAGPISVIIGLVATLVAALAAFSPRFRAAFSSPMVIGAIDALKQSFKNLGEVFRGFSGIFSSLKESLGPSFTILLTNLGKVAAAVFSAFTIALTAVVNILAALLELIRQVITSLVNFSVSEIDLGKIAGLLIGSAPAPIQTALSGAAKSEVLVKVELDKALKETEPAKVTTSTSGARRQDVGAYVGGTGKW